MNIERRDPIIGKAPIQRTKNTERPGVKDLLEHALAADGAQHKQWYLWQIADLLGYALDIDANRGIAP